MVGVRTDCPACNTPGAVVIFTVDDHTRRSELVQINCPHGCQPSEKQTADLQQALGLAETTQPDTQPARRKVPRRAAQIPGWYRAPRSSAH